MKVKLYTHHWKLETKHLLSLLFFAIACISSPKPSWVNPIKQGLSYLHLNNVILIHMASLDFARVTIVCYTTTSELI